ncbi:homeobox protein Mohawk-like [Poecilia formosa]|uniref:homeobox protein Mohawk-like n=1 Tax=Poecilia formosa TaxID=48698 RepID=UPI0004438B5A|nr:PREDICTED: homeobox protein Mohawk-like [Poecilia formosa]XP_016528356.1 PREDICTED: homeobox protein Mohawk-like [Poecilia formosa]
MDKFAAMKTDEDQFCLDNYRRAEDRIGPNCEDSPQTSLTDGQSPDMQPAEKISALKYRRCSSPRSRLGGVKARHKRQVLQDMARPLKHWLYKHRDNPYPTKTEKVLLALGSHMTLVQVSNWFANARRRLKNTVRQPDLSWALRIKLYNKYIQGNAERLSVCSDDTNSDDEECTLPNPIAQSNFGGSSYRRSLLEKQASVLAGADCSNEDDGTSPPSKYKSSLLNRYLNDTLRHMMAAKADAIASARGKRCLSQSFSSNECDRDVVSPDFSSEAEANFIYSMDTTDNTSVKSCRGQLQSRNPPRKDGQGWREIHAAVALTSLAQGKSCKVAQRADPTPGAATGQSCTAEPFNVAKASLTGRLCVTGAVTALKQSAGAALTSRIIQKSSHISEVQTVKAPLANTG